MKNYEDFSVTPVGPALPPINMPDSYEKKHTFRERRLSSTMIPEKSLDYTITNREIKRSSGMGIYNKDSKGNYTPISPLRYPGNGGHPHFSNT